MYLKTASQQASRCCIRISYYRGIPVSLLEGYEVVVDGEEFTNKDISFSLDGDTFYTMEELGQHPEIRWEYGDKAYLHIKKPGGFETRFT